MLPQQQEKLDKLYLSMVKALKRQGMADVTVDTYSRAITRIAHYFGRCPDELNKQDLKDYFDHFITIRSWSTVRADRCGLQFFWKHVLNKKWKWVDIVKPPQIRLIQELLGHEDPKTTLLYTKISEVSAQNRVKEVNNLVNRIRLSFGEK